ncbi:MAG: hypothetical protein IJ306_00460 [Oscillospiraceae bacterium]|nr:hypothetical protein [Oscillospiraceae bacterium]
MIGFFDSEKVRVYCPVKEENVGFTDCMQIMHEVNGAPKTYEFAKDFVLTEEKRNICINCRYRYPVYRAILWGGKEVFVQRYNDGGIYATEATEPKDWKWFRITKFHIKKWLEDTPMNVCLRLGMHHWF